jgi:hypothetical protein
MRSTKHVCDYIFKDLNLEKFISTEKHYNKTDSWENKPVMRINISIIAIVSTDSPKRNSWKDISHTDK